MHCVSPAPPWWKRWWRGDRVGADRSTHQVRIIRWGEDDAPTRVVVKAGRPIQLVFERLDVSVGTEFIAIPALGWVSTLGATARSCVELAPCAAGAYDFASVDGALHGCLVVEP